MRRGRGIVAVVIAVLVAVIPGATAGEPKEVLGIVAYENGTRVPDGWLGWAKNVNRSYNPAPFTTEVNPFMGNIYTTIEYDTVDESIRVNCTSPDGRWFGENTRRFGDAWDTVNDWLAINVTVYEVPVETENFTRSLAIGWNLVSLPLTPDDNSTSAVLDTIPYDAVKRYNAAAHQFEEATTMDPGVGYFIHMTAADTWSYEGTAYESMRVGLSQGLHCIGWANTRADLPGALRSITGSYRYVARWNATSQSYEVYEPNAPSEFNDFDSMERGGGYFIAARAGCMLTYP